jgi:hypothetical protein
MSRYRFELAVPDDDTALRQVLARNPLPGRTVLGIRREPNFFAAAEVEGSFVQVIACRDLETGAIIGIATRSIRDRYHDGVVMPVGYLGSLRIDPEHRGIGLVARGFRFLRELDEDGRAGIYLTSLAKGNTTAARTLLGGRAGLPEYRRIATWISHAVPLFRCRVGHGTVHVQQARADDLPEIIRFLNTVGRQRDFFPVVRDSDFERGGSFRGLRMSDMHLAIRRGKIIGTFALWEQTPFRQIVIEHYPKLLRWLRPFINAAHHVQGLPGLPRTGEVLPCVFGSLFVVAEENAAVAQALVAAASRAYAGPAAVALVGYDARSSLGATLPRSLGGTYETAIHLVSWNQETRRTWDAGRTIHLEEGCL